QAESIAGGLALLPMRQWWGGQRVAMTGIASVGIAPEYRGSGAALTLLQHMLQELFDRQVPLSVLYPATQRLYRKVGYEQGGTFQNWSISPAQIQLQGTLPFHAVEPNQTEILRPIQQQYARLQNGHLDRHPALWQQIAQSETNDPIYAYVIGSMAQPEGYVVFTQQRTGGSGVLRLQDWAILSAEAGRSLWGFLAGHRSQIDEVRFRGAAIDPWLLLLPEQEMTVQSTMQWMLRIVNVPLALAKRGYPPGIETELHLEVKDDWLPENSDRFVLSLYQGQAQVERGGKGELKLDIRGLAPLYSGLFTPHQLAFMGYLDGSDTALHTAARLFAGSSPWLPEFF
ncbi:MAG TPA: GNAT family N-acetyltransferase, partial [Allocoleopsis sp.]